MNLSLSQQRKLCKTIAQHSFQTNVTFTGCMRKRACTRGKFNGLQQQNETENGKKTNKETNKIAERPRSSLMVLTVLFVFKAIFVKQFGFRSRTFAQRF